MTLWQNLDMSERIAAAQTTATNKNIEDRAVEAVVPSLGVAARICKELQIDPKLFIDACCRL